MPCHGHDSNQSLQNKKNKSKLVTKISSLPAEVPHARPQEVRFITCYVGFNNLLQCYIPSWFKGGGGRGYIVFRKKGEQGGEGMGKRREEEGERERKIGGLPPPHRVVSW